MISNYEIRKFKHEEILYIYIDDSYEFARINKGKKRKKFLEMVSDFIKNNDIKFAGSTIAIVAGGLVIGNLFLNKTEDINLKNCIVSLHLNPQIVDAEVINDDFLNKGSINNIEEMKDQSDVQIKVNEEKSDDFTIASNKSTDNSFSKTQKKIVEVKEEIAEPKTSQEIKEAVTVFRLNGEILTLEMEEYLINVVAAEMPASFNIEALKAQSVLARTYAKKAVRSGKVLTDSVSTQVYKDDSELKSLWGSNYKKYYSKIKEAVVATSGEVLKYNGDYIEAVYHSTSNGYTEDAVNVWGNSFPYLKIVESMFDKSVKNYSVTTFFSYSKLSDMLGFNVDNTTVFNILNKNSSSRVSNVLIGEKTYSGVQLRNLLSLRSADFDFEILENGVNITTKGYGHGVGMSQYGANEMAKYGSSYIDILKHYYNGTSLEKE